MMKRPRRTSPIVYALYANAAVLLLILAALVWRPSPDSMAMAQRQPPIAGGAGIFVMPAQVHTNVWGCYLLDVDRGTLCTYEYQAGNKTLLLTAARSFRSDLSLKDFNTFPSPTDVQRIVEEEQKSNRVTGSKQDAPTDEQPKDDQPKDSPQ